MSEETNTDAIDTLARAQQDLKWVLRTTEEAVGAVVAGFQGLTGDADCALTLAGGIVECVDGENVSTVLPRVHSLGDVARQFITERMSAAGDVLDTVTREMDLLKQLSSVTEGQAKVAMDIKVLNIHTKVEVAHLGQVGAGFQYLARELAEFSSELVDTTGDLIKHTESRKGGIQKTKGMLSVEIPRLREELAQLERSLCEDLAVLEAGLRRLSETPARFKQSTQDIAGQIAGVVVAVQGHDITRQQIEHVDESLDLIAAKIAPQDSDEAEAVAQPGYAHAGLKIQAYQLRAIKATIEEWTSQIRLCIESILRISASDLVGIGPLVLEQERTIFGQLAHIESLEKQCRDYGEGIRSTLEGISNFSNLVTDHLQKSEAARNRLRFLTFNSVIEASHLGSAADTICVIADGIGEVAGEWTEVTKKSGDALKEIEALSMQIDRAMGTFAAGNSASLSEAMQQTRAGLQSLREAAAFSEEEGRKIEAWTATMRSKIEAIGTSSDRLDACFGRIDSVLEQVEAMKQRLEVEHPGVECEVDAEEIEREFSASYTTQAERQVLQAAMSGAELSIVSQSMDGNSVELF